MAYQPRFDGCHAKLERANEHFEAFHAEMVPSMARQDNRVELLSHFDPQSGYHLMRVETIPGKWIERVATIIGDIVNNQRSALDHLIWQLALVNTGGQDPIKPKMVTFPIGGTPKKFCEAHGAQVIRSGDRTILEEYQPYKGWKGSLTAPHPLNNVRKLSNDDKHRLLTPILLAQQSFYSLNFPGGVMDDFSFSHAAPELTIDAEYMRVHFSAIDPSFDPNVEVKSYVVPLISIGQGQVALIVLNEIMELVAAVIQRFDPR